MKVCESHEEDNGKGLARMDVEMMEELGVRPGDVVDIEGLKKTTAVVGRSAAYPYGVPNFIRIDGKIRYNAETGIRETVKVSKVC
ncbi:MAG: hypothetical protein ABH824_05670 [Nanoarchaeota archaeon]